MGAYAGRKDHTAHSNRSDISIQNKLGQLSNSFCNYYGHWFVFDVRWHLMPRDGRISAATTERAVGYRTPIGPATKCKLLCAQEGQHHGMLIRAMAA